MWTRDKEGGLAQKEHGSTTSTKSRPKQASMYPKRTHQKRSMISMGATDATRCDGGRRVLKQPIQGRYRRDATMRRFLRVILILFLTVLVGNRKGLKSGVYACFCWFFCLPCWTWQRDSCFSDRGVSHPSHPSHLQIWRGCQASRRRRVGVASVASLDLARVFRF